MNGFQALASALRPSRPVASNSLTLDELLANLSLENAIFPNLASLRANVEEPDHTFAGFVTAVYSRSPIAFACLMARWKLFSQARFQFQQMFGGRRGALFGTPDLAVLEHPEPGETTVDLAIRAISDADLEGDWFGVLRNVGRATRIKRIRPDWTTVVLGSRNPNVDPKLIGLDPDTEVIGFGYQPGGAGMGNDVIAFSAEEVAHFHPNINPLSRYRGAPLVVAALHEVLADQAATSHKLAFFKNGASPAIAISMPPAWDEKKAKNWIDQFEQKNTGALKAYRTIYFNAGMKAETVGSDFQQMTFKELQGSAETRLAAVTGIHPVVVGLSEGLQGSSLNSGNFQSAARASADVTLRWLWANFCGSVETIIPPPRGSRLWYEEESIPFLQADVKDKAEVLQKNGSTIGNFVDKGFTPESAVDAVVSGDFNRLVHTGLPSVQLQPAPTLPAGEQASYRATRAFWAAEGALAELGRIDAGAVLAADHKLVRAFPSVFEPASLLLGAGGGTPGGTSVVTTDQVLAKRRELEAAGQAAGYDTLARELNVSPATIRRRLGVTN